MRRGHLLIACLAALVAGGGVVGQALTTDNAPADEIRSSAFSKSEVTLLPAVAQVVDGKRWWAGKFTNDLGETCVEIRSPAGWRAAHCPPSSRTAGPQFSFDEVVGGTADNTWIVGLADPAVTGLRLQRDDCTTTTVALNKGVFLYVFSSAERDHVRPYKLSATSLNAAEVERVLHGIAAGRSTDC